MQVMHETLNLAVPLKVVSRITNYHRPEYPQIKTCAKTLDSRTDSDEIIGLETSNLVTDTFGGTHKDGSVQYDYFLSLDRLDKTPTRSRIHVMKLFSEVDYDCVRLEKI